MPETAADVTSDSATGAASRPSPPWRHALRVRILAIALLPTLVGVLLATTYFANRIVRDAEQDLHRKGLDMAARLAQAVQYELFVGNTLYIKKLLDYEQVVQGARVLGVADRQGRWEAFSGESRLLPLAHGRALPYDERQGNHWLFVAGIQGPDIEMSDPFLATTDEQFAGLVAVVLDDAPLRQVRAETLAAAAGIACLLLLLTGLLAWRLSARLGDRLQVLARVVDDIANGALDTRVAVGAVGELGVLEQGVNRMAITLQDNRDELERRIREATSSLRGQTLAAEAAVRAKSRFLAAASHDLRQPLHAMTLLIAALKDRIGDGEAKRLAEHVEASASAMEGLLNALLDLSRLDAGAVLARPECFSVQPLFRRLEQRYAPLAADKGLRLRFHPTRVCVHSDPMLLERILNNLISNAIRYTDRGGVLVGMRRGRGGSLRFEVWDSGRGVPTELSQRIFEEYFQLDNPERDRDKGLGLGLAIVDRLTRLLGSRVSVKSVPGRGSCFGVQAQRCETPSRPPETESTQTGWVIPEDALVVFVDDDEAILEAMLELFENWGMDLAVGTDGQEVITDLQAINRTPSLVLCDYRLRDGATGLEAIAQIRQAFGDDLPAVLITGDTAPETLRVLEASGLPVLHKPLKPAKLRALVGHYLGARPPA